MVVKTNLIADVLFYIKNDLKVNITDPISSGRATNSQFIMTSYPQRAVQYPLVTIKISDIIAARAGMQTTNQDFLLTIEVRIWARNEKEKEEIYTEVINRLANIQFTATTGSIANDLFNFNITSSVEVDSEGESNAQVIKSRVLQITYNFYG